MRDSAMDYQHGHLTQSACMALADNELDFFFK